MDKSKLNNLLREYSRLNKNKWDAVSLLLKILDSGDKKIIEILKEVSKK